MRKTMTAPAVRTYLMAQDDLSILRIHYCYQIGSTFVNLALMEDTIIDAMWFCNRIKVENLLGPDTPNWNRMLDKRTKLQNSTLGKLISILSRHDIEPTDLHYLKWVKAKRDFFVHRFFHQGGWPGELDAEKIDAVCRELLYLEVIFVRASRRIWQIFGRANLAEYQDLGKDGVLMMNLDLFKDEGNGQDR